jgi:2-polyprenyl-3-methyl-5-hydroxy-6-metoxy-1,4-benzoquinol methylase
MLDLPHNSQSQVVRCVECHVLYLWPYISEELLSGLYGKEYFTGCADDNLDKHVPCSDSNYESEFASSRIPKFLDTVRLLLKLSPNAQNILDIGAATGEFLSIAMKSGLAVAGIEVSSYASARAKEKYGFEFYETGLVEYQGPERYDLIHMNHVFEHLDSPHQALTRIFELLNEHGLIYVEVPFQFNWVEVIKHKLTGHRKRFDVFSLHHPIFYTPATLKRVFEEHGFQCKRMRVFCWSRYPASGVLGHIKKVIWLFASFFGQGLFIEAIFAKASFAAK